MPGVSETSCHRFSIATEHHLSHHSTCYDIPRHKKESCSAVLLLLFVSLSGIRFH